MNRVRCVLCVSIATGAMCFLSAAAPPNANSTPAPQKNLTGRHPAPLPDPGPGPGSVNIETVVVANPGNPGEVHHFETFGQVDYIYEIAKYEVTAGQYTAFLNAIAATDTYRLVQHQHVDAR